MKYQTWEVIKMLTENPKLKFVNPLGKTVYRKENHVYMDEKPYMYGDILYKAQMWELIPQEVPFIEAVKAYSEGKTIRCEINGHVLQYAPFYGMLKLKTGQAVTAHQILSGKWYVEE